MYFAFDPGDTRISNNRLTQLYISNAFIVPNIWTEMIRNFTFINIKKTY